MYIDTKFQASSALLLALHWKIFPTMLAVSYPVFSSKAMLLAIFYRPSSIALSSQQPLMAGVASSGSAQGLQCSSSLTASGSPKLTTSSS